MRWGIAFVVCGITATAAADVRDDDQLEADKLFQEGRALLEAGKRADACAKFDLSFRKDPRAVGTMLNLGLCAEEAGQVATAVRYYGEARDRAHDQALAEHQQAAERKIALLAPRVPHLAITLPANAPDAKVIVDAVVLSPDQLRDVEVDPGERSIVVTAAGKLPFEKKLTVAEGAHETIAVPALEGSKTVIVRASPRRLYGQLTVAGGLVLAAGAVGLGLYGRHLYWDQFPSASQDGKDAFDLQHDCFTVDGSRGCNARGQGELRTARNFGYASTATGVVAALVIGAGAYLWLTAPDSVSVDIGPGHAGAAFTASW
jgi:tetratricopeptide (TPR) repeat protein